MIINWDVDQVISECRKMHVGATNPYMTGWNNWPCKQDLYRVKFAVDAMLAKTSMFGGEEEWLEELEKEKVMRILKHE